MDFYNSQKGYVVSMVTLFMLIIMLSMALSMSFLVANRQKNITSTVKSTQSYYASEAGIEDALLRLKNAPQMPALVYDLNVNNALANVNIPNIIGGARVIVSRGDNGGMIRNLQTVYSIDTEGFSFYYGVQVGEGGLTMNNGSRIVGNVFSDGDISGGNGTITNDAIVAGNGHHIKDITVLGNAFSHSCLSPATIEGDLTYVAGGTKTCSVQGETLTQFEEIPSQPLPISQSQITDWKSEAASVGIITGDVTFVNGETQTLGPVKITGKLTVSNGSILNMRGTIYVAGDVAIDNVSTVKLDSSYGSLGGVILSDNIIEVKNNSVLTGSGQTGSYLLVLSTSSADPAIIVDNNASGAIFYTSNGAIQLNNNIEVKEATGYKINLSNNATVEYDSGLANLLFSSGPSGGWRVTSWQEQ